MSAALWFKWRSPVDFGTSMSVWKGLGWSMDAWNGSWLSMDFWIRKRGKCLWWWVWSVVRVEGEARVGWKARILVICWEKFGMIWWVVVLGILEEVVLGSGKDFRVFGGDSGLEMAVE